MLAAFAAIFLLWVIALPGPADAAQRRADGVATIDQTTEFGSRHRRWHRRHYHGRRYYRGPRYAYRYSYRPYYYRPYYYRPYRYYYYAPPPFPFYPFFWW
jgi:hypothetical protein